MEIPPEHCVDRYKKNQAKKFGLIRCIDDVKK